MSKLNEFISNHWELWVALIVVAIAILFNEWISKRKQAVKLSPQTLVGLMNHDEVSIYDIRAADAFKQGHILNAVRAQKEDFEKTALQKLKDTSFVVVCDSGIQSSNFAAELKAKGFSEVKVLNGGMRAWNETDLPIVKGK